MSDSNLLPDVSEFMELKEGEMLTIRPLKFKLKKQEIHPKAFGGQVGKEITVMRIWYDRDPKVPGLDYWDISAGSLIVTLHPILQKVINSKKSIRITARGYGVNKRYGVTVI